MDPNSPAFQKLLRLNLNEEFGSIVDKMLEKEHDGFKVSQKIIQSKKMKKFMANTKDAYMEQQQQAEQQNTSVIKPHTSLSFIENDLFEEEWSFCKGNPDTFEQIIDNVSSDKPDHVRLAGYEILFKYDLENLLSNDSWELFLSTLQDSISDDSRPIFEAGLQMYTKLLSFPYPLHEKSNQVFINLMSAYDHIYEMKKLNETLPTTTSGINFKILLHEKICRIMYLLIRHQEEILKSTRSIDRNMEDMIEQFFSFLSSNSLSQSKSLNALNIIAVLEPQAEWSRKWNHSFLTRKLFCHTLSKVPFLLQRIVIIVTKYVEYPPTSIPISISDDVNETFISGDSVEALTYLHCLNFMAQLYAYSHGRALLFENLPDNCLSVNEFLINILNSLNTSIISEVSNGIYEAIHRSLIYLMDKPVALFDTRFSSVALNPLMRENDKLWPHILHTLMYILETADGRTFIVTEYQPKSASSQRKDIKYPAEAILLYASNLLKQPLSVMNIEHLRDLFQVIEQIFDINEIYDVIKNVVNDQFCPAIKYFYNNVDKYFVENENKTQKFNKAAKIMLIKMSSIPLLLKNIVNETSILRELIQDSIAPLRNYWNVNRVIGFISNAAFFSSGFEVLTNLAPYILSTFIIELCKRSEEPLLFHDPWTNRSMTSFQHILYVFSLNTKCFMSFMITGIEEEEKQDYPVSLYDLYQYCLKSESYYHYVSLITLKSTIWNLDIFIFLLCLLDFQEEFLKMQGECLIEVEDDDGIKEKHIIDKCSLMRHIILTDTNRMEHKIWDFDYNPEELTLFSKMPSFDEVKDRDKVKEKEMKTNAKTELEELLEDDRPGLKDSNWIAEARRAFKMSSQTIMNISVFNLLNQMQEAVPTVDWVEHFSWNDDTNMEDYWLPEEIVGFDVVMNYAQINKLTSVKIESQHVLKVLIKSTYSYIKYNKSNNYRHFDWFLSTIFLVCCRDLEKCKTFLLHFIKLPSAMYIWPILSEVIDQSNNEETTTRLLLAQLLENIINNEFSTCSNALKHNCGTSWWMICDRLMSQCFWGILPWSEIVNYLIISILYPPDYILYYCASLLNHCQYFLLKNVADGKLWPDNLFLKDFKCHNQIGFMDQLGKRYRGKILPLLTQRKLKIVEKS